MAFVIIPARNSSSEEERDNLHMTQEDYYRQVRVTLAYLEDELNELDIDLEFISGELGILYRSSFNIWNKQREEKKGEWNMAKHNADMSNSVSDKSIQSIQELLAELQR